MTEFMINKNTLDAYLIVCHKFSTPADVSKIIYDSFLHSSAQIIIDKWKSYLSLYSGIFTTKKARDLAVAFDLELQDKSFYAQGRFPLEESYKVNFEEVEEAVLNSFVKITDLTL